MSALALLPASPRFVLGQEFTHKFLGYGTWESSCNVRVFTSWGTERASYEDTDGTTKVVEIPSSFLVLITETGDGTSVTKAIETIASQVLALILPHDSLRDRVHFVEHCPAQQRGRLGETFDQVSFAAYDAYGAYFARNEWRRCYSGPRWSRLTRAQLQEMLGPEVTL